MNAAKRISLKGLADFMTAGQLRQRKVLQDYKYPEADEPRARILYYQPARDCIALFHSGMRERAWLYEQADMLQRKALVAPSPRSQTKLNHNARGLRAYGENFAGKRYEVLADFRMKLEFGDVTVSIVPDMHIYEDGTEKVLKFDFSEDAPDTYRVRIVTQALFEALTQAGLGLPNSSALFVDVVRGVEHQGARMRSKMHNEIVAACANISAIWDSIPPPPRRFSSPTASAFATPA